MMVSDMFDLVLATTNRGKLKELQEILGDRPVALSCLEDYEGLEDVEETGATFAENARLKARYYSERLDKYVLADDSGLQVDALEGAPGVYSARFAGVEGPFRDRANNQKLLELLAGTPGEKRRARFCCALCLSSPSEIIMEVEGFVEGVIAESPRGTNGFGYDPLFYVPELGKTVAELPPAEKNAISHRGRALAKLLGQLDRLI